MTKTLSRTMTYVLREARRHGKLIREPGGFWTFPGCAHSRGAVPDWYAGTTTINALVERGVMTFGERKESRSGGSFPIEAIPL